MIQELLQRLKEETVRSDFLNSRNKACRVDTAEMDFIDTFAQQMVPSRPRFSNEQSFSSSAKTSAEHFSNLIDGRNRQFMETGFTYEKAKELFNRIQSCGYWEKDVKFVEAIAVEDNRAENDTPISEDLESKDGKSESGEKAIPVSAPPGAQVPTPAFNGSQSQSMIQQPQPQLQQGPMARGPRQQHQQASLPAQNAPLNLKTTLSAVENSYFNQVKFSQPQGQLAGNGLPITPSQNDFATNFSFLQESLLDSSPSGSQQKTPVNVIQTASQPKNSPVQHQQMQQVQQPYNNANFHPQSPIAGQMYPPGLKVQQALQNSVSHIPVHYQASPQQQLNQQSAVPSSQVPPKMIPKQQPVNGSQVAAYGVPSQTPPIQQQHVQPTSRPAYPTMAPKAQFPQQLHNNANHQNVKPTEPKQQGASKKHEGSGDVTTNDVGRVQEKEKLQEDYQQQPQIDTWSNETAAQSGGSTNYSSRSSGGFSRNNRSSGGGAKFNNYRWVQFVVVSFALLDWQALFFQESSAESQLSSWGEWKWWFSSRRSSTRDFLP